MIKFLSKYFDTLKNLWNGLDQFKLIWKICIFIVLAIIVTGLVFGTVIGLMLGIYWLLWKLVLFVVPFWFPAVVLPDYWTFAGTWFLLVCIKNVIFTRRTNEKTEN